MSRLSRSEDESKQVLDYHVIVEHGLILQEDWEQVSAIHFALSHALLAICDVLEYLGLASTSIVFQVSEKFAKFDVSTEEQVEWSPYRVIHPFLVANEALFTNISYGFPHAYYPFSEGVLQCIVKVELEFVIVEVFTEAYMVDCVGENALKRMR